MPRERIQNDAYYTPQPVADACVRVLQHTLPPNARVLEPHAGGGAFVRALRSVRPDVQVSLLDKNPDAPAFDLAREHGLPHLPADFLSTSPSDIDWIVGNPPYADALAHVEHALRHTLTGVGFLMRLAFLEGAARRPFFSRYPPCDVHVLVNRPSFAFGKTDSAAYAFFVWRVRTVSAPRIHWLNWRRT
jgi:hypothetical protein